MGNKGQISVIIPVYNTEKYVKKCLDSVVNQTYDNLEIIIIDDGSTDSSGKIIDEYAHDDRCIVVHQENTGIANVRNVGLSMASGEYVSFIDSDDYADLNMLWKMIKLMEIWQSDMVVCNYYILKENNIFVENVNFKEGLRERKQAVIELLNESTFHSFMWNKLYRRELFENITFIPDKSMEDFLILPAIFEKAKSVYVSNIKMYFYNMGNTSNFSNNLNTKNLACIYYANQSRYMAYGLSYPEAEKNMFISLVIVAYRFFVDAEESEIKDDIINEYQSARNVIKENIIRILGEASFGYKFKVECICVVLFPELYKKMRNFLEDRN